MDDLDEHAQRHERIRQALVRGLDEPIQSDDPVWADLDVALKEVKAVLQALVDAQS